MGFCRAVIGNGYSMMSNGGGIFMMLGMFFLIILSIILVMKYFKRPEAVEVSTNQKPKLAMQILDERYARGEISDEEYRQKKIELLRY